MSSLSDNKKDPQYQFLQIELTNRCNLSCTTCLRSVPGIDLQEQDLDPKVFQSLESVLTRSGTVHLQGWGESMLLANLPERIYQLKKYGCMVSFTTSGSLMTRRWASDLVACGLDSLTFSMAGATVQVQDKLRGQGTHKKLWQSIQLLQSIKQEQNTDAPSIAVSYLLTRDTIRELPQAVKQCRFLGVSLFAGVHLTHAATDQQQRMSIYSPDKEQNFKKFVRWAHWHALWGRMRLQLPPFQSDLTPVCDKNPLGGCFIAADGSVAPCVFLYPSTGSEQGKWFTRNGKATVLKKTFGHLGEDSLDGIWQSSEYRFFRKVFQDRLDFYDREMGRVGFGMDATERLERARNRIRRAFLDMPVPECCSSCPKMEGF